MLHVQSFLVLLTGGPHPLGNLATDDWKITEIILQAHDISCLHLINENETRSRGQVSV